MEYLSPLYFIENTFLQSNKRNNLASIEAIMNNYRSVQSRGVGRGHQIVDTCSRIWLL